MNMEKTKAFLKKYGFYVAVGVISVGAITAVFLMPNMTGNVEELPNPYASNEAADGKVIDEIADSEIEHAFDPSILTDEMEEEAVVAEEEVKEVALVPEVDVIITENGEVASNNFNSTTAEVPQEPFFVDGDTLVWPVSGQIVVPYKDETTSHWLSQGLNQTMRTFGVCISGEVGDSVKAAATGTVEAVITDSATIDTLTNVGNIGQVIVIDHGNGYKTLYGMQKGKANDELVGKLVKVGDEIGTVGAPSGPFVAEGANVYLQVLHNDEIVNPEDILIYKDNKYAPGLEMGHAPDGE